MGGSGSFAEQECHGGLQLALLGLLGGSQRRALRWLRLVCARIEPVALNAMDRENDVLVNLLMH